jgi:hypothetical protein
MKHLQVSGKQNEKLVGYGGLFLSFSFFFSEVKKGSRFQEILRGE